jgi:UDP-N-acetylglucosamine 2-epimerase (non-hydrolysing)
MITSPSDSPITVVLVAGARPNFMKVAPLLRECERRQAIRAILVHTGQHYDAELSDVFFRDLGIRPPDYALNVGSGSHAEQTAEIMRRFEPVCSKESPKLVLVVGDVNSTMASALVAVKLGIPVGHVEAGLRSYDRTMPEEINRIVTDAVASWHFTTEPSANENLRREGIPESGIHFVGNVMIDTLLACRERAASSPILERLGLRIGPTQTRAYGVVTLHRPSNVDDPEWLESLLGALREIAAELPLIFPVHPRTSTHIQRLGKAEEFAGLCFMKPLGYIDFLQLIAHARVVITDSGGIQEETTILRVPCLTVRDTTERPVTIDCGWNRLVGTDPATLVSAFREELARTTRNGHVPPLWDGKASQRIVDVLLGGDLVTPLAAPALSAQRP